MFERAGAPVAVRHWALPRYVTFMVRQYLLVILVPMLFLLAVNEAAARLLPQPVSAAVGIGVLVVAALMAGPWVCFCWRTERLPEGRLRQRLLNLARRAGIRVSDVRIWRTNLSIANGCMIGLVGPLRYILITDALLLSLSAEEVEAVFAHEAAHVTYRHPLLFFVMTLAAMSVAVVMGEGLAMATQSFWVGVATMGTIMLAYLVLVFGYVSRRCELECDLFAVRATECPGGCSPPDARRRTPTYGAPAPDTSPEPDGWPQGEEARDDSHEEEDASDESAVRAGSVCGHRVKVFIAALRRIARLNGAPETRRGLRHFSIAKRCRFLEEVLADPPRAGRAEQRIRRLKTGALLLALVAFVVAGLALAANVLVMEEVPLEPDEPEHPTRPEDEIPPEDTWIVRIVDRHEMDAVTLRPPQFDCEADAVAYPDDGGVPLARRLGAPGNDDVAVADAWGHAVAVHAQGEGAGVDLSQAGQTQELRDALSRGGG
jgi:Zn-dependent protease with chaperone function